MHREEINFDTLEPQGFYFSYRGKHYVLREAPESVVLKYRGTLASNARFDDDGKPTSINIAGVVSSGIDVILVAGCSFELLTDGRGKITGEEKAVSEATVQGWPHSMVERLKKEAERLTPDLKSDKGDAPAGEDPSKNGHNGTPNDSTPTYATATN